MGAFPQWAVRCFRSTNMQEQHCSLTLRLVQTRLKTFRAAPGTAKTLGGGAGRRSSSRSINVSQNIHIMCWAERLSFTRRHPLLTPRSPSSCRVSRLEGNEHRPTAFQRRSYSHSARTQSHSVTSHKVLPSTARCSAAIHPELPLLWQRLGVQTAVCVWWMTHSEVELLGRRWT